MKLKLFAALLLAASAFACGGVASPSSNKQENFSLVVQPGSASDPFPFSAGSGGSLEYSIFISTLTPAPPSGTIGVSFGQNIGGQCSPIQQNGNAVAGHTALSGEITPGTYCVQVFDPGIYLGTVTLAAPVTVTGYVSHP